MLFPPIAAILFFIWLYCAVIAPRIVLNSRLNIPGKLLFPVLALAVAAGPVAVVAVQVLNLVFHFRNQRDAAADDRAKQELQSVQFENVRGSQLFDGSRESDADEGAVNTLKRLILDAVNQSASDIFIDPQPDGQSLIRFRVDGVLKKISGLPESLAKSVVGAVKVISSMDISEHRRPQDGAFAARISGMPISFRVASVGAYFGEKLSIRVLGNASGPRSLEDLGLSGSELESLRQASAYPSGLVLICGPTGSGKTSTLYALLRSVNCNLKNVISIEDPIENIMPEISQMEVNPRADITFATLLRNALRQNPDVICIGEIRDAETAMIATQAAQTGHLIVATVHSNDNLSTVLRLQSLGVPLRTISSALRMIVSQRLVRTLCPNCRRKITLPENLRQYFADCSFPDNEIYEAQGCAACDHTGYSGRRALFDILAMNSSFRELLERDGTAVTDIQHYLERKHGDVLTYHGFRLVSQGVTTIDEVSRVAMNTEPEN